jgi:hypothetical protein
LYDKTCNLSSPITLGAYLASRNVLLRELLPLIVATIDPLHLDSLGVMMSALIGPDYKQRVKWARSKMIKSARRYELSRSHRIVGVVGDITTKKMSEGEKQCDSFP